MALHPDPTFPLPANEQVDVIRIYLKLKRESDRSGRTPEAIAARRAIAPRNVPNGVRFPDELYDLD